MARFFREIPGYPNYIVSVTGLVYSKPRLHHMSRVKKIGGNFLPHYDHDGRIEVSLQNEQFNVGALILLAFVGPRPTPRHQCCHNDGNYRNNNPKNVRWGTVRENFEDRKKHGTHPSGVLNARSRVTEDQVREIRRSNENQHVLAARYGLSQQAISAIKKRVSWKHVAD